MVRQNAKERLLKKVEGKVLLLFTKKGPLDRTLIGYCKLRGMLPNICFYYQVTIRLKRRAES